MTNFTSHPPINVPENRSQSHAEVPRTTTVLVVDDSATDRRLVGKLLERNTNWKIFYAASGEEAFSQVEAHLPDIVLADVQMPGMDGLELAAALQQEYPLVPVVVMTARGSEELAIRALESGAASYIPKNQAVPELRRTIERVLNAAGEERGHSRLMHRLDHIAASFSLENDLTLIPSMISYLQQLLMNMRICEERHRLRVGIALEEALLNSYYHGNLEVSSVLREQDHAAYYELAKQRSEQLPYRNRRIYVTVKFADGEAAYIIRDEGPGFNPCELPDATDPANVERPCGRGLLLMRTFMDEVRFNALGNEVTMIKRRNSDGGNNAASHKA